MSRASTTAALVAALLAGSALAEGEATPALDKNPLDDVFAAAREDGPVELPEPVRLQIVKLLPPAGRGQQCEKPAQVQPTAVVLRDRGQGALLVAMLESCNGETAFAFAPGTPMRIAKLFENEDARRLVSALSLPLRGGEGATEEIALVLSGRTSELRFFVRRSERGFAFAPSGSLPDFGFASGCDDGDQDHAAGYQSLVRVTEARKLLRLRLEQRCGGGLSSVRCEVWHLDQGQLAKRGSCALPLRLEEAELRKVGWK